MAVGDSHRQIHPGHNQHIATMSPSYNGTTAASIPRSRPQCTHRSMTRLHGPNICDACGQTPSFGWLYLCIQDTVGVPSLHLTAHTSLDQITAVTEEVQELIALGISASIIDQYQAGSYTSAQIQRIKDQKRLVYERVSEAMRRSSDLSSSTPQRSLFSESNAFLKHVNDSQLTPRRALKEPPPSGHLHRELTPPYLTGCQYKCCHRCRPYLYDRLPASIDAVLKGEEPPLSPQEIKTLPILDCRVLKDIDHRSRPYWPTNADNDGPQTPNLGANKGNLSYLIDDLPLDHDHDSWTPCTNDLTSPSSTEASTSNVSSASSPATPLSTPATGRDYRDHSPAMRKVASWHHLKSSMLPSLDSRMFHDRFRPSVSRITSIDSYFSTADSVSAYSEELEVVGGVALTEEAIETGLPDILTDDMTSKAIDTY